MKTARVLLVCFLAVFAGRSPLGAAQYDQRLAALSTRGLVGSGDNIMIMGFSIGPGAPKKILVRALGPRLTTSPYNLSGTLANPLLQIYDSNGIKVLENDDWSTDDAANITAATSAVGLGALTSNSRDAVILATLSPGNYTAQIKASGTTASNGIALLEVYDVTGSARLMAISTRALVGSGANILIPGLLVAPGASRHVLVRASGPGLAGLNGYPAGVPFVPDPVLSVLSGSTTIASNNDWDANNANAGGVMSAVFAQAGAFPFVPGSKDAALVIDLAPGGYTIQVGSGNNGPVGLALVEVYDLTNEKISTVSVSAGVSATDTNGSPPARFDLTRAGDISAGITVAYTISGTAVAGTDYNPLSGTVTFPAGVATASVLLTAKANPANINNRTATLTLSPNSAYGVGANDNASVTIFYNPGTLFMSSLRTAPGASASTAFGTATIQLASNELSAAVNVSFSDLSSAEVVAHLAIDGYYVMTVPQGQVVNAVWNLAPVGLYSTADLIAALKAGRVTISIDTASYPTGELIGSYTRASGSAAFLTPASVPAVSMTNLGFQDAARFMTQATFGATSDEIGALMQKGYSTWINEQLALPASLHLDASNADMVAGGGGITVNNVPNVRISATNRQSAWWKLSVNAPDQLRQRVAFALSEILVISDQNATLNNWQDGVANYYDLLVKGAFGNFRQLLEQVTLDPNMGVYLSMLRNAKSTKSTVANENYAREVMQLFTIGLYQLQPDGTLQFDLTGQPIPTYNQATISETAKVFTGWGYFQSTNSSFTGGGGTSEGYLNPMVLFAAQHDITAKTIVGGKILPANQSGAKDLQDILDTLFNHPNTGPFISRQLIQRLVTSNPSPGYVYRVAQVFANNGAGVRGDLGAVVRAILTDYEARSATFISNAGYGKPKEPLLLATALLRAFKGAADNGRYSNTAYVSPDTINNNSALSQASLRAPTVFNFFLPDFIPDGTLAAAGLYAPEYQLLTGSTAITIPNYLYNLVTATRSATNVGLDYSAVLPLVKTPQALLDQLNTVLSGGSIPKSMNDRILSALATLPTSATDTDRVRTAIYLTITSPEGVVQK